MCLAVPMKVIDIKGQTCIAESGGLRRTANISFLKKVRKGDYILIHAGFAIEKVKEAEAIKTLKAIKDI